MNIFIQIKIIKKEKKKLSVLLKRKINLFLPYFFLHYKKKQRKFSNINFPKNIFLKKKKKFIYFKIKKNPFKKN